MKEAQIALKQGLDYCLVDNFDQALKKFQTARELFLKAGNVIEADTMCLHFIAYCYVIKSQNRRAHNLFQQVSDFCAKKGYKWFFLMNLDWLIGNEESLEHKSFTEIEDIYKDALKKAEDIKDNYTTQKFLLSLIRKSDFVKQELNTLNYLHELLIFSKQPNLSARQKFRNFDKAISILARGKFPGFSLEVVRESVSLAEPMADPLFIINAHMNTAIVYMQAENFTAAGEWLKTAGEIAKRLEGKDKQMVLARIFLQMGHLERKKNNLQKACEFYDESLKFLAESDVPILLYEIKKSRLAAYQQAGNDDEVKKDLDFTLNLAEEYREKILDEQDRNKFFDNEQGIYDIAIEHKLRSNELEEAYNYSEISNSRSLLDSLLRGVNISFDDQKAKVILEGSGQPLKIDQVQKNIPATVQLLQYSVLGDKVLIWIITKDKLLLAESKIDQAELKKDVETYLKQIREREPAQDLARKIYDLLVKPALPQLDKNKEICIIPDKILFLLPFASLLSPDNSYFLEDFTLFYSPSANVFAYSTEKAKLAANVKNEKLLSVGNPAFDAQKFRDLKNLSEAETEARQVAGEYTEATILIGEEATKKAFLKLYRNYEVIHFAGHYVVQTDSPLFSKLVMAKSPGGEKENSLTNIELIKEKLPHAKLIVLSSCRTGTETYSSGEGLVGLSRTFLSLGVPVIVASQWKVDSDASAEIMINFHRLRRQKKLSISQALRESQLALLRADDGRFRDPYLWAAFAAFGGYARY